MAEATSTPFDRIGGERKVRELVDRFYDYMDALPHAKTIRDLHAKSLRVSREKLFLFLCGWLGGPDLYQQRYGHPMLRRRHLPFSIGVEERDQWLLCMDKALGDMELEEELKSRLEQAFFQVADHMRNRTEPGNASTLRIIGQPMP